MDADAKDREFMREALREAQAAYDCGEVPIGAVLVVKDEIIARAHNRVEQYKDATQHAEMLCLQMAMQHVENWRLNEATLYCTLEPCPMCAGAMIHSRLKTLVWGARDLRCGAHGSWINMLDVAHPIHRVEVRAGVLEAPAAELMRNFFREQRKKEKVYVGESVRRADRSAT
jgi:tRNA(adenine34) deaminase